MNDAVAEPPLTRRELRRLEEAARAPLDAQESSAEQPPVPAPATPAAALPQPRSSPSGRVPQWAVEEAAGIAPRDTARRNHELPLYGWQQPPEETAASAYVPATVRYPSPVRRFFRALGRTISDIFNGIWDFTKLVALTVLMGVAIWNVLAFLTPGFTSSTGNLLASRGIIHSGINPFVPPYTGFRPAGTGSAGGTAPPPGLEAADHRLGSPAPVAGSSDSYAFLSAGTDQQFISYDPCRPIHYVVRPSHAPPGGEQMIAEAVAAVSRATGFVFIYDGLTNEAPSTGRPAYQLERYGNRWAPVLFAWETPSEQPKFTESLLPGSNTTLGLGGSTSVTVDNRESAYVTGQVRLNSAALGDLSRQPDGSRTVTAVVKHELAHVVGLDHVPDQTQLMTATMTDRLGDFSDGDLTGLAMLGVGKCRPAV